MTSVSTVLRRYRNTILKAIVVAVAVDVIFIEIMQFLGMEELLKWSVF